MVFTLINNYILSTGMHYTRYVHYRAWYFMRILIWDITSEKVLYLLMLTKYKLLCVIKPDFE